MIARHPSSREARAAGGVSTDRISVLVADDEETLREALGDLVRSDPRLQLVGSAADADEAIRLASELHVDVAIVDVKMPGGGGPRVAREINSSSGEAHVIALSAYDDRPTVLEMLRAGAVGYIVKGSPATDILKSIHLAAQGQSALSVEVTSDVIHELVSLLERSEQHARDLRELDRRKSELIQVLSHELLTPISAIQGSVVTMASRREGLSAEAIDEMAETVTRAGNRIRRLVNNVGAAAQLQREGIRAMTKPTSAGAILSPAASEFPAFRGRLQLPVDISSATAMLLAEPQLAVRALVIVLENALLLSSEEDLVEVQVRQSGDTLEFHVLDRGPGVPPDMLELVFEPFTQADGSTTRSHGGLGVGLYLARRIMEAHGGTIHVSARDGGGSDFVLAFPAPFDPQTETVDQRSGRVSASPT